MSALRAAVALALTALAAAPAAAGTFGETEVRKAARSAGFAKIADRVVRASRPTILIQRRLVSAAPAELGTSRVGGDPDLPAGRRWPRCRGRAQTFLGQIRLEDLPPEAGALRAHGGVLLLFTDVEFEDRSDTEFGLWAGECSSALHAPSGATLVRTAPPRRSATMRLRPAQLSFTARPDVPDLADDFEHIGAPLQRVSLSERQADRWAQMRERLRGGGFEARHRALGYPDLPNGGDTCWLRTQRPRRAWQHLFTMDYDPTVGFEVADGGRLQVMIAPSDMRRGRFDRVCGVFDSA